MNRSNAFVWLACLMVLSNPDRSLAQEEKDESVRSCISVTRIRNTRVVDDRNVLFYLRGSQIYHNILPRQCHGLSREGRFSFHVPTGNLCQLDSIRVLYSAGLGLEEGISCQLGYFHKITKEDAEGIIEGLQQQQEAKPLPPAEPEDVTKESDEPE